MFDFFKKHIRYLLFLILILVSSCIGGTDETGINKSGKNGSDQLTPPIAMPSPTLDEDRLDEISFE